MPTIVPLTPETHWLESLRQIPNWDAPMAPTIVLAPHPDDETLGAGGLIARLRSQGIPVTIVAVTDGENAYVDAPTLGATRVAEQTEALARLGVPSEMIHRFQLPDCKVAEYEEELVGRLLPLFSKGMHVVAPWTQDFHPDHEAVGRAARRAAQSVNLHLTYYLFWTWHRGKASHLQGLDHVKFPLTQAEIERKLYALDAHVSQFEHANEEPILNSDLLAPARRSFEVYIR